MTDLAYASELLTAWHTDPCMDEGRHQHTWKVTAYFAAEPFQDGRSIKASLRRILDVWDGSDLPPELWSDYAIARTVLHLHGNADVCGVQVDRVEGHGAKAGVCS